MTRERWTKAIGGVVVLVGVLLLFVPVKANYIAQVGSDTIEYRVASCGAPTLSMFGADPGLGGGAPQPIGAVNAEQACKAASGRRVIGSLALWLIAAFALLLAARRREPAIMST